MLIGSCDRFCNSYSPSVLVKILRPEKLPGTLRSHYQLNATVGCTTVVWLELSDIPGLLRMGTVQSLTCDDTMTTTHRLRHLAPAHVTAHAHFMQVAVSLQLTVGQCHRTRWLHSKRSPKIYRLLHVGHRLCCLDQPTNRGGAAPWAQTLQAVFSHCWHLPIHRHLLCDHSLWLSSGLVS